MLGCDSRRSADSPSLRNESQKTQVSQDGFLSSGIGVEKQKPEPGKGNVQGKVLYNGKPAENIEVKLCETFDPSMNICGGEFYITVTDANGEYFFKNVA